MKNMKTKKLILSLIIAALGCLLLAAPVFASGIVDPMYIGVGARPLGMGKA